MLYLPKGNDMRKVLLLASFLVSCGGPVASPGTASVSSGAHCNSGYCYSYLLEVCCPASAPYACGNGCYTYSGGGGCSAYETQCY